MSGYYIRRGTTIRGPFSAAKIKSLFNGSKLRMDDEIATSAEGPWKDVQLVLSKRVASESNPSSETDEQTKRNERVARLKQHRREEAERVFGNSDESAYMDDIIEEYPEIYERDQAESKAKEREREQQYAERMKATRRYDFFQDVFPNWLRGVCLFFGTIFFGVVLANIFEPGPENHAWQFVSLILLAYSFVRMVGLLILQRHEDPRNPRNW